MSEEIIKLGDKTIILVGTAHVSDESVKQVEQAINEHKPDAVAVELCQQRYLALKEEKKWDDTEITKVIESDKIYLFLLQILLGNFQRKIGDELGVKPGSEMMKAVEISEKQDIPIILADRNVKVTLKRAIDMMSLKEKIKILTGVVSGFGGEEINKELVEKLKEKDVLTEVMEELAAQTPSIKRVLVDERDQYIAQMIYRQDAKKIVAIVGAGHMTGIIENLNQLDSMGQTITYTQSIEGENIQGMSKSKINFIAYGVPTLFLLLIIWGFISNGASVTGDMMIKWFLVNGTLSAIGAACGLAHPLTILTAFIAAPFTSLNPAIAAGWVAGYVEIKVRKPRVVDFKNLMKLKTTADYFKNRVVRVVLIVAFANIGSTLGTFIGFGILARIANLI